MVREDTSLRRGARGRLHRELAARRNDMEVRRLGLGDIVAQFPKHGPEIKLPEPLIELLGLELLDEMRVTGREPGAELLEHCARRRSAGSQAASGS